MWSSPQWLSHGIFTYMRGSPISTIQFNSLWYIWILMQLQLKNYCVNISIIIGLHTSVRYLFTCQRKDSSWFLEAYRVLINLLAKFLVGQPELSSIKIDWQWIIFQPMAVTSSGESRDGKQRWKSFSDRCKLSFSSVPCGFASCLHILLCKMGSLLAGKILTP